MNILILAKGYPPTIGGVENYSKYISEGLSEFHNVRVLTFAPQKDEGNNSYTDNSSTKVKRIAPTSFEVLNGLIFLWHYILEIIKKRPDFIFATTWKIALPCALMQWLFPVSFVLTAHGAEVTRVRNNDILVRLMRFVFSKAARVVSVSSFTDEVVKQFTGADPQKCKVVSNGIDLKTINKIKKREALKHINTDEGPILLSVSRLDKRKGHDEVIKSLPLILHKIPELKYIIVGNGPEKQRLKQLVKEKELQDTVIFTGYVSNKALPFYYSACDVFIMLNIMNDIEDFEGFGFVFAEAGAYQKPAIAGDNSGPREVIEDAATGYLVRPDDHEQVANKVIKLFKDESLRYSMGMKAEKRVQNKFTTDIMVQNLNEILHSVA